LSILTNRNKPKSVASKTPRDDKLSPLSIYKYFWIIILQGFDSDHLFTLDQLTDQGSPLHIHDNMEELLQNIKLLNNDIDSITKESLNLNEESFGHYTDPSTIEIKKTPTMLFLIKDMNLNINLFYKDMSIFIHDFV